MPYMGNTPRTRKTQTPARHLPRPARYRQQAQQIKINLSRKLGLGSSFGVSGHWIVSDRPETGEDVAAAVDSQPELDGQVDVNHAHEETQDGTGRAVQGQVGVDGTADPGADVPSTYFDDGLLA